MSVQDLNLALLGKTGMGKSTTGNIILGYKAFPASDSSVSCTKLASCRYGKQYNVNIRIVDTPGLMDTEPGQDMEYIIKIIPEVMGTCPNGFDALVLVLKYGERFTEEQSKTLSSLRQIFGSNFVKDHCIVIITNGDSFDNNHEDDEITFKDWCQQQTGPLGNLFQECENRFVLFYNKGSTDTIIRKRNEAVKELLDMAAEMGNTKRYTHENFRDCFLEREKLLKVHDLPQKTSEIEKKLSLLLAEASKCKVENRMTEEQRRQFVKEVDILIDNLRLEADGKPGYLNLLKRLEELKSTFLSINLNISIVEQMTPIEKFLQGILNQSVASILAGAVIAGVCMIAAPVIAPLVLIGTAAVASVAYVKNKICSWFWG